MKLLMTAKSFGYGSASKLVTIARSFGSDERRFVGDGIALDFARRNRDHFTSIEDCEIERGAPIVAHLRACDALVSVRNAEAVFWARRCGVRSVFVDSLLWFWKPQHGFEQLVELIVRLDRLSDDDAWAVFAGLPEHDRAILGHLLADASVAQRFPGVDERVADLRRAGVAGVRVCGPILFDGELQAASDGDMGHPDDARWDVVVNVCGYDNFLLDSRTTTGYLELVEQWVVDYAERHASCRNLLVCGGPYSTGRTVETGRAVIRFTTLARQELLRIAAIVPRYLCSPGLTSVLEMIALSRVPRMGPPQHSCHLALIRTLGANGLDQLGLDFCSILADERVPVDDLGATAAIVSQATRVLNDRVAFRAVADRLDELLELSACRAEDASSWELQRLRQLVAGADPMDAVAGALATTANGVECRG